MTDVTAPTQDTAQVDQAVALLKLRKSTNNPFKLLALELKLKDFPDQTLTRAKARIDSEPKKRPKVSSAQATLKSATLTAAVRNEPTIKGHSMTFEMKMDLPKKAKDVKVGEGEGDFARDLYGVTFEWWEEIVVDYDFTVDAVDAGDDDAVQQREALIARKKAAGDGAWEKPWSDIYLSNPQSQTFYMWNNSLREALGGSIREGSHTTSVNDNPAVNLDEGSFKKRTLRFRIEAGDASGPVFKGDAIQVLVVEDGKLTSSLYQDSTGASLKSGAETSEPMRYRSKVSTELRRTEGADFVKAVEGGKQNCTVFDNTELEQAQQFAQANNIQLSVVHKDLNQSNRMNAVPLVPSSDQYWQRPSSDGGLLIAHLSGRKVKRLFHTDDVSRELAVRVSGRDTRFTVRTFEQLPLD
jgi:hypothetical protein